MDFGDLKKMHGDIVLMAIYIIYYEENNVFFIIV